MVSSERVDQYKVFIQRYEYLLRTVSGILRSETNTENKMQLQAARGGLAVNKSRKLRPLIQNRTLLERYLTYLRRHGRHELGRSGSVRYKYLISSFVNLVGWGLVRSLSVSRPPAICGSR